MVGPFMQGILLVGIIYWYSKGLINMINDYYRGEFNRKLKTEVADPKYGILKPQSYDLDDMEQLLNIEMNRESSYEGVLLLDIEEEDDTYDTLSNEVCYNWSSKSEFYNILFLLSYEHYRRHPLKYAVCWYKEDIT